MATYPKTGTPDHADNLSGVLLALEDLYLALSGQLTLEAQVDTKGKATAAAPSYSEGTENALSMDLAGRLRALLADGSDVTQGAKADAAQVDPTQTASIVALVKGMLTILGATTGAAVITDANGTVQQYLRGLIKQWIAGTLTFASVAKDVAVSMTRTNDTNAYTANDVLGAATGSTAALDFANVGPSGGAIMLTSAEMEIDAAAVISGETSYRLYLYNVTPPSALGDNAAWDLPSGDRASFLGYVDLGTPVDLGSTLYVRADGINAQFKLSGTDLFGYLVTNGAYTPTASRVHKVTLHTVAL